MKDKFITYSFTIVLFSFFLINIFVPDNELSYEERRKLKTFPSITVNNLLTGSFMDDFEKYSLDQFVGKSNFRFLKSYFNSYVLGKKDNNGVFIKDGYIYKMDYNINKTSISNWLRIVNNINDNYLKNNQVYYSIIPDKNYFLDDSYPNIDYKELLNLVNNNLDINYINIIDELTINDYYKTDTHWKQNRIYNVVNKLSESMKFETFNTYKENNYYPFYGVYYGNLAQDVKLDTITYLTNEVIDNASVYDYEYEDNNKVYNASKLGKMESYDVFLDGASAYIEITNNNITDSKELVIFRDSFGSSIAPLLINSYKKITLIDLRYINMDAVNHLMKFNNQDVLFLYSTLIINNSNTLKG